MKQPIRYFSIGLLTASLITLIFVFLFDKQDSQANEGSVDEMIATLTDEGYHVLSSSEYISLSVVSDSETDENEVENSPDEKNGNEAPDKDESKKANTTEVEEDDEEVEEIHKYTLTVEPNMLGPTVSKLLQDNNIIDDADEFNQYLEKKGYAPYLQLGDHKLTSDMSNYEIAEAIAKTR